MYIRRWLAAPATAALLAAVLAGCGGTSSTASSQPLAPAGSSRQASPSPGQVSGSGSPAGVTVSASAIISAPAPSGSVVPGHDTPEAAAAGYLTAIYAGNHADLCTYLAPSAQADCASAVPQASPHPYTGSFVIHGSVIVNGKALVEVTGKECTSGGCMSNTDPANGMPGGSVTFQQAYDAAIVNGGFSPVICVKVSGKWYIA